MTKKKSVSFQYKCSYFLSIFDMHSVESADVERRRQRVLTVCLYLRHSVLDGHLTSFSDLCLAF